MRTVLGRLLWQVDACEDIERQKKEAADYLTTQGRPPNPEYVIYTCLERDSRLGSKDVTWLRYQSAEPPYKYAMLDMRVARARAAGESKARITITQSLYPFFALRELLPRDVAWIIVVLAHWGW